MNLRSLVKSLRQFRKLHKFIGIGLAFFFLVTASSGLLLGWKKNVELLQPATLTGASQEMKDWKSFHEISVSAQRAIDSLGHAGNSIDRLDVRPDKGIVKVLFKNDYLEAQVDCSTAKVLSVAQRHSDWIEHIHDGSIFSEMFKLIYTNILGIGLITLAVTGVWLWYGPKQVRKFR